MLTRATPTSTPFYTRLNVRAELRRALLAGADACWLYAIALTLGTLMGFPRAISPFGIFIVYYIGLSVGRLLPYSDKAWRVLQLLTIAIAVVAIFIAVRVGLYTDLPLYDLTWIGTYTSRVLAMFERVTAEEIATLVLIGTFVRALGFAQRPLTLWVIGFQFRLGIVIFFATAFLAAITVQVNFIFWIFVYFALSLVGIALARIEEAGQERPLGPKWALVLAATVTVTMLCGYALTQFLTLDAVNAFFTLLSPLTIVIQILATIIAIPFFYLFEFLWSIIAPLLSALLQVFTRLIPNFRFDNAETQLVITQVARQLETFVPYLRLLGVIAVLLLLGAWIARALNRRVKWQEQEMFERERLDEHDEMILEKRKRPPRGRAARREIHAENVRRLYAAMLAHAEALGLKRRDAETPSEFLPRLAARFPQAETDLATITTAYIAVHYAQQPATETQVRELRARWHKTREQMRASSNP